MVPICDLCRSTQTPVGASRTGEPCNLVKYRSALFPLSEDGIAIDHVLGAANHRLLREKEELIAPLIRTKWL